MIRVILSWLGWAFIAFGSLEIAYEIYVMLSVTADTANSTEQARAEAWKYLQEARSEQLGNGLVNLALGAIMVGVYQLLIKADRQNVTPMKAKKDLGNWPPSVQGLKMKQLLLILSVTLGLASPVFADLKAAEVIEKGTLIHKEYNTRYDEKKKRWYDSFNLHIAYNKVMYQCLIVGETNEVSCFSFKDDGTY